MYCLCVLGICLLMWVSGWLVSLAWVVFVGGGIVFVVLRGLV